MLGSGQDVGVSTMAEQAPPPWRQEKGPPAPPPQHVFAQPPQVSMPVATNAWQQQLLTAAPVAGFEQTQAWQPLSMPVGAQHQQALGVGFTGAGGLATTDPWDFSIAGGLDRLQMLDGLACVPRMAGGMAAAEVVQTVQCQLCDEVIPAAFFPSHKAECHKRILWRSWFKLSEDSLRMELERRGLSSEGLRLDLMNRLSDNWNLPLRSVSKLKDRDSAPQELVAPQEAAPASLEQGNDVTQITTVLEAEVPNAVASMELVPVVEPMQDETELAEVQAAEQEEVPFWDRWEASTMAPEDSTLSECSIEQEEPPISALEPGSSALEPLDDELMSAELDDEVLCPALDEEPCSPELDDEPLSPTLALADEPLNPTPDEELLSPALDEEPLSPALDEEPLSPTLADEPLSPALAEVPSPVLEDSQAERGLVQIPTKEERKKKRYMFVKGFIRALQKRESEGLGALPLDDLDEGFYAMSKLKLADAGVTEIAEHLRTFPKARRYYTITKLGTKDAVTLTPHGRMTKIGLVQASPEITVKKEPQAPHENAIETINSPEREMPPERPVPADRGGEACATSSQAESRSISPEPVPMSRPSKQAKTDPYGGDGTVVARGHKLQPKEELFEEHQDPPKPALVSSSSAAPRTPPGTPPVRLRRPTAVSMGRQLVPTPAAKKHPGKAMKLRKAEVVCSEEMQRRINAWWKKISLSNSRSKEMQQLNDEFEKKNSTRRLELRNAQIPQAEWPSDTALQQIEDDFKKAEADVAAKYETLAEYPEHEDVLHAIAEEVRDRGADVEAIARELQSLADPPAELVKAASGVAKALRNIPAAAESERRTDASHPAVRAHGSDNSLQRLSSNSRIVTPRSLSSNSRMLPRVESDDLSRSMPRGVDRDTQEHLERRSQRNDDDHMARHVSSMRNIPVAKSELRSVSVQRSEGHLSANGARRSTLRGSLGAENMRSMSAQFEVPPCPSRSVSRQRDECFEQRPANDILRRRLRGSLAREEPPQGQRTLRGGLSRSMSVQREFSPSLPREEAAPRERLRRTMPEQRELPPDLPRRASVQREEHPQRPHGLRGRVSAQTELPSSAHRRSPIQGKDPPQRQIPSIPESIHPEEATRAQRRPHGIPEAHSMSSRCEPSNGTSQIPSLQLESPARELGLHAVTESIGGSSASGLLMHLSRREKRRPPVPNFTPSAVYGGPLQLKRERSPSDSTERLNPPDSGQAWSSFGQRAEQSPERQLDPASKSGQSRWARSRSPSRRQPGYGNQQTGARILEPERRSRSRGRRASYPDSWRGKWDASWDQQR